MKISARNQFAGKVVRVKEGSVNGIVTLDCDGMLLSGTISLDAIKELGLTAGSEAVAIVKATEVMIGTGALTLSARNKLAGTVASITTGAVNSIVSVQVGSQTISATISMDAVQELGLAVGSEVVAVMKATSVLFGVHA